jgi:hypothetical protein
LCPFFSPLCARAVWRPVFSSSSATLFSQRICAPRDARLFSSLFSLWRCGSQRLFSPQRAPVFSQRICARLFSPPLCERVFSQPLFSPLYARVFSRCGRRCFFWRLRNVWQPVCESLFSLFSQRGTSAGALMLLGMDRRTGRARGYRSRNSKSAFCAWRRFSAWSQMR